MKTRRILITGNCFIGGAHCAAGTVHELSMVEAAVAVSSGRATYYIAPPESEKPAVDQEPEIEIKPAAVVVETAVPAPAATEIAATRKRRK